MKAIAIDGHYLYSTSDDWIVKVWDKRTGTLVQTYNDHSAEVISLFIDKKNIFSGSRNNIKK